MLRDSTPCFVSPSVGQLVSRLVGWLVGQLVGLSVRQMLLFYVYDIFISLILPKWTSDLKYGPCPPARNWGGHVSIEIILKINLQTVHLATKFPLVKRTCYVQHAFFDVFVVLGLTASAPMF